MQSQTQARYLILFAILIALTGFSFDFWTAAQSTQDSIQISTAHMRIFTD